MFDKFKRVISLYRSDSFRFAKSAKAGTIDMGKVKACDLRKVTFGEKLALIDKVAELESSVQADRYIVVYADGYSQKPNNIPFKSLCVVDKSVPLGSLKRGDTVLLRLTGVGEIEAYKMRMFTSIEGENILSIKFDKRGTPSETASSHLSNHYIGKLVYKLAA
jgi:hypothetical protein